MDREAFEAIERIIGFAKGPGGQSRFAADFILACWNADAHGGFDPVALSRVDDPVPGDALIVLEAMFRRPLAFRLDDFRSEIYELERRYRDTGNDPGLR